MTYNPQRVQLAPARTLRSGAGFQAGNPAASVEQGYEDSTPHKNPGNVPPSDDPVPMHHAFGRSTD